MPNLFYNFLFKLKNKTEDLNWGREIIKKWGIDCARNISAEPIKILDLGSGRGCDLLNITKFLPKKFEMFGVENNEDCIKEAEEKGIKIIKLDLEKDRLPFSENTFDIIIANQIIEHLKEIFWFLGEISRVIKKNSIIIIGAPNLASLHNRIALFFGLQPTSINPLSAHVRGFTKKAMIEFIEKDGYFKIVEVKGSNFYPFPGVISSMLAKIFPNLSVALFYKIRRTDKEGNYLQILNNLQLETPFYKGLNI